MPDKVFQIVGLILVLAITGIHARIFANNRRIGPWFHFFWASVYFVVCGIVAWALGSWSLAGAFCLIRLVFYNPVLNWMRGKPLFYLGVGQNGSWWDWLEMKWEKAYPYFLGLSAAILTFIQFLVW